MLTLIKSRLHLKFALVLFALLITFTGCTTFLLYQKSVKALQVESLTRLEETARAWGNEINIEISNTMQITEMLSFFISKDFDLSQVKRQVGYIDSLLQELDPFIRGIAKDFSMAKTAYIYYNWELDGVAHDIYYVDFDNNGDATRQEELPITYFTEDKPDRGDKKWWYGPIETKKGFWSPPYKWTFDDGSYTQFMSYTKAIFIENQLIGVVGTDFKYSNLIALLDKIKVYDSGFPFLLDANQILLIHPTLEGRSIDSIDLENFDRLKSKLSREPSGIIQYRETDGQTWLIAYSQLSNNWTLGLSAPLSEITQSARSMALWAFILVGIFFPIIIIASYYTAKSLISPVHDLTDMVQLIGIGNYSPPITPRILHRQDELGTLGVAIIKMGVNLKENIQSITENAVQLELEISEKRKATDSFNLVYEAFVAAQNGMIITDANLCILHSNPSFLNLTEFTTEPAGLSLESILQLICGDETLILPRSAFYHQKIIITHEDSPKRYLWLIMTRIENKDGQYQYIGVLEDQTETIHQAQSLEYFRDHDVSTGLMNKTAAIHEIRTYLKTKESTSEISAILAINIDDFRRINEAMGYDCGDAVIIEISKRLKDLLQNDHILARTAGDEFLVFLKSINTLQEIETFGQHLIQRITQPIHWRSREIFITLRGGLSIYPFDTDDLDALFNNAITALISAKSAGKNTLHYYSQGIAEEAFEKYELSNQLRVALEQNEFFLVYQPIVALPNQEIWGAEALIRWQHPTKGLISPDQFIPLAESGGTIDAIGLWVIKTVCRQLALWKTSGDGPNHISINLSTLQLNSHDFSEQVAQILNTHDIPFDQINIEITESALILQNSVASENLANLKSMGFKIHIDDFGTGFSSLSYLRDYHIDVLKIDRSFIRDIPQLDSGDIARLIIDLSKSLGIEVIAEGVETEEQLNFLILHGCHYMQGYYYSRPLSPEDFSALDTSKKTKKDVT